MSDQFTELKALLEQFNEKLNRIEAKVDALTKSASITESKVSESSKIEQRKTIVNKISIFEKNLSGLKILQQYGRLKEGNLEDITFYENVIANAKLELSKLNE